MKIQQNPSLDYLKNCLSGANSLNRTIEIVQHFPPAPCYSELLRFSRGKQKESMLVVGLDKLWAKL